LDEGSGANQYQLDRDSGVLTLITPLTLGQKLEFSSEQTVLTATGGETLIDLESDQFPLDDNLIPTVIKKNGVALSTPADYTLDQTSGKLVLTAALSASDVISVTGKVWRGLLKEISRKVEGVPTNRTDYPGLRAAGTQIIVTTPADENVTINAFLVLEDGYTQASVRAAVELEWTQYFGGLAIGEDVIRNRLIDLAMDVDGVTDMVLLTPVGNVIIDNSISAERARLASVTWT